MSQQLLVTFNAGSSTVKIGLFAVEGGGLTRIGKGMIDFRKAPLRFELSEGPDRFDVELEAKAEEELDEVLREAFDRLSGTMIYPASPLSATALCTAVTCLTDRCSSTIRRCRRWKR